MLIDVVIATVAALAPLVVVAVLFAPVALVVDPERLERPVIGVIGIETAFLVVAGVTRWGLSLPPLRLSIPAPAVLVGGCVAYLLATILTERATTLVSDVAGVTVVEGIEEYDTLAMVAVSVVLVGPAEELLYRGVIQPVLTAHLGTGVGIAWMAVLFGAVHYPSYGADSLREADLGVALGTLSTAVAGAVLGVLTVVTGTLVVPIVAHSLYDALLFAGYVPFSDPSAA